MRDKVLTAEIDDAVKKRPFAFWGFLLAVISIAYGEFLLRAGGYLLLHSEPYMTFLPEKTIAAILIGAGLLKALGVVFEIVWAKKIGIWLLTGIWTGLTVAAFAFSFGTGYPMAPGYIFHTMLMAACYRVSIKGDFTW